MIASSCPSKNQQTECIDFIIIYLSRLWSKRLPNQNAQWMKREEDKWLKINNWSVLSIFPLFMYFLPPCTIFYFQFSSVFILITSIDFIISPSSFIFWAPSNLLFYFFFALSRLQALFFSCIDFMMRWPKISQHSITCFFMFY